MPRLPPVVSFIGLDGGWTACDALPSWQETKWWCRICLFVVVLRRQVCLFSAGRDPQASFLLLTLRNRMIM
jgi:hypothetical protein